MANYADEQLARENDFLEEHGEFPRDRYRAFAKALPADFSGDVLDMGCARGLGGSEFKALRPGSSIDGSELVTAWIERIPPNIYRHIHQGIAQDLADEMPGKYDAVLAGELIEHVPYDQLERFIAAVSRLLRPGGHFLLTTPNPHYVLLKRRSGGSVLGGAHVSVHCSATLSQLLEHLGFRVQRVCGAGRVSKMIGTRAPLSLYGSFFVHAVKPDTTGSNSREADQ